ncbi:hypothetical protein, partial [Fontibacillus panacisegetis]|uniref:hypothetical protein n=1 Tax=Fontibacillus panacisegetis TaxID=670482 RepID=UPI001C31BC7B
NGFDHLINDTCHMMIGNEHFQIQNHMDLLVVVGLETAFSSKFPRGSVVCMVYCSVVVVRLRIKTVLL